MLSHLSISVKLFIHPQLSRLIELKDAGSIDESIDNINWLFVTALKRTLQPVMDLTVLLQTREYTVGDFRKDYWVCVENLRIIVLREDNLASPNTLYRYFQDGQKIFLENIHLMAGLYLDPRYNHKLGTDEFLSEGDKIRCVVS